VGTDTKGTHLCEATLQTTGDAVAVKLTAITAPAGLKADGADVALIEVQVVDAQGRRCPTNLNVIDFELTGPAEWRGGIAQGPDNFILSKHLPLECGVNRVFLRSLPQAGKITLNAKSEGLQSTTLELESKPVKVADGLTAQLPGDDLPARLDRGPTPAGPSFKVTRIAIPITGATAGANTNRVATSCDDNEETSWSNDNKLSTAWIRYEFGRAAAPTEVALKLVGWRQRSYPLRISVDDREVYSGATPRSLGYVTLPLKPVNGRSLKIELTAGANNRDGFNLTELENQQNAATGAERSGSGTLGIVEFECYEAAGATPASLP
jgi:beta-galactosidase